MSMIRFEFLDKSCPDQMLPRLFDILHTNMRSIAPTGKSYEDERQQWLAAVAPALEKAPRQIILMYAGEELSGYFQYYVNGGTFMVEEIQIVENWQSSNLLLGLIRFLWQVLPEDVETIAAYAHKENHRSQAIIGKLGMEQVEESRNDDFWFYSGDFRSLARRFGFFIT